MPGGADWQYVRGDGVLELEARYSIRTKDGTEIAVTNRGMRRAPPEIMDRLSRGESGRSRARLLPHRARCSRRRPARMQWLNESVFVATAARFPDKVQIRVFEVL